MKNRILIIMGSMDGGGAEKVLIDLLSNWDYGKYSLDLCLIKKEGVYLRDIPREVNIIGLYEKSNSLFRKIEHRIYRHLRFTLLESYRINRKIKENYDSIISFLEGEPLKFHSYIFRKSNNNISWVHVDLQKYHNTVGYSFSKRHEVKCYEKMDTVIFVSNETLAQFKKKFNISAKKRVIYNPINCELINAIGTSQLIKKSKTTICAVGRLAEQKAFERLIRVASLFSESEYDLEFWILGDGPLKSQLVSLRNSLGLEESVHFLGFIKAPYAYMKESDIFLSTSIAEGFSLVICEALCLGKPILSTKCAGPNEILGKNEFGILVDHDDLSIYEGIKNLLDDKKLQKHYQKQATYRSKMFNVDKTMTQVYSII